MMKKEVKTRGVFNINNLTGSINSKLDTEKNTPIVKKYGISLHIDENVRLNFEKTFAKYIFSLKSKKIPYKKDFFRLIFVKYKEYLEKENKFFTADNEQVVNNLIRRSGHRMNGVLGKSTFFGMYTDDTQQIFENVAYSIAHNEQFYNYDNYKKEYFFAIVLEHFMDNFKEYIK